MKKIFCIYTILILAAIVNVAATEEPYDKPWLFPQQTEVFSANALSENVELVVVTRGRCTVVAVDGNTAYIGAGVYLLILDITDNSAPALLGSVQLPGVVYGIAISSGYAYITDSSGRLCVVDVREPASPYEVGFYDTPGSALDVAVSGGYAYIANSYSGLRIVDVSNPENPNEVGFYDTPGYAYHVAVSGGYAYIADYTEGLYIVDVSNPENPHEVGYRPVRGDVAVSGSYAYIADSRLHIVDVKNPENPDEVGFYDVPGYAWGVTISGDYAHIAGDWGLWVVDVSNPENPDEVGFYDTPGGSSGVAVSNGYAYIAGGSGFFVVDVSNPENPHQVGFYDTPGWASDVAVSGGYAHIAGDWGLWVVDVSNPENPDEVGFYDTPGGSSGVAVSNGYAYIAGGSGFFVVDVSNPENPHQVGFYDTPEYANDVAVSGGYAYIANSYSGLRIVDVSNPENPYEVGFYDAPGIVDDVAVSGGYAYVADLFEGLRVVDVSNPENPNEVGFYDTPGSARGVAVSGGYAYIADYYEGLRIVDVSNPENPYEVGFYDTPGRAYRVAVANDLIYVADGSGGMSILRFTAAELSVGSVSPSTGPATGGTEVKIYGTNFKEGATVTIGGNDAINPVVDPDAAMFITAVTPPRVGDPVDVVVTNPDGESATLEDGFMYIPTGDISADGIVSAYDATLILQYVVGLITEFPADRLTSPSEVIPQDYELHLPNLTAKAGERIYVPLALNDVSRLFAGGVTIKYDANVLRAVKVMPVLNGVYHEANISRPGEMRFAFATAKPVNSASELLMVEFYVMPNTEGKISPLLISDAQLSESLSIAKHNGLIEVLPAKTALLPNYPNPFNPETWIPYQLSAESDVTVEIYNHQGRLVRVFDLGMQPGGSYVTKNRAVYWNGENEAGERVASGVYFYQLKAEHPEAGVFSAFRRLVVVK